LSDLDPTYSADFVDVAAPSNETYTGDSYIDRDVVFVSVLALISGAAPTKIMAGGFASTDTVYRASVSRKKHKAHK
jgi:hypothetical protein